MASFAVTGISGVAFMLKGALGFMAQLCDVVRGVFVYRDHGKTVFLVERRADMHYRLCFPGGVVLRGESHL